MHSLIVQTGKHKGKKIVLPDKQVLIGREETSFIRMTSTEVSRQHCSLTPTDKGLLVRDLSSQNGTLVNNVKIEAETLMQPGDLIQIGPIGPGGVAVMAHIGGFVAGLLFLVPFRRQRPPSRYNARR
jgi:pSer/pThr/pTyr-binding forkhead associated (FHA) protein